jgi:UDP:flavonoid glycosyltransferase YjiC (YdhE family)
MTRFLFVSLPLQGHLDWGGMLKSASTLSGGSEHEVAWASGPAVQPAVETANLVFLSLAATGWRPMSPLSDRLLPAHRARLRQQRALDSWLHGETVHQATVELADIMAQWRPDVIVAEPYAAAAALSAERLGLPLIVCGRPALPDRLNSQATMLSQRVRHLCQQTEVPGDYWDLARGQIRSPLLHVDYFSRHWYADLPAIAPQTRFVGGQTSINSGCSDDHPPTVLVTLGSLFNQDPHFFQVSAEAILAEGGHPLAVTGRRGDSSVQAQLKTQLPAGAEITPWVDFSQILPRVTAMIHHGGVGTTHAALQYGIPQVAVPHAGDQGAQAGRITQAGVGFGVRPADFSLANARWLVRQLLQNQSLRTNVRAWRAHMQVLGGVPAAVQAIETASKLGRLVV